MKYGTLILWLFVALLALLIFYQAGPFWGFVFSVIALAIFVWDRLMSTFDPPFDR